MSNATLVYRLPDTNTKLDKIQVDSIPDVPLKVDVNTLPEIKVGGGTHDIGAKVTSLPEIKVGGGTHDIGAKVTSLPEIKVGGGTHDIGAKVTSLPEINIKFNGLPEVKVGGGATPVTIDGTLNVARMNFTPGIDFTFRLFGFSFLPLFSIHISGSSQ